VLAGCNGQLSSSVTTAHASITAVPDGVQCVEVQVTIGNNTDTRQFDVKPGTSPVLELNNLSPGAATFLGHAFNAACRNIDESAPDWISDPVPATLKLGIDVTVELLLKKPAAADVGIGFAGPSLDLLAGTPNFGNGGYVDGVGGAAAFSFPWYMTSDDGIGKLYVSDDGNRLIRQIDLATSTVTTLAGTPGKSGEIDGLVNQAKFTGPSQLAWDGALLYVADRVAIRVVAPSTGEVVTLAGSATAGLADGIGFNAQFKNTSGIVFVPPGTLYIGDENRIRKLDITTAKVTTIAGDPGDAAGSSDGIGSAAKFNGAFSLVWDGASAIYIADGNNNTIRKLDIPTLTVTTAAGVVNPNGGYLDGPAAGAQFNFPNDISFDKQGRLLIADESNCVIRRLDLSAHLVSTIVGKPGVCVLNFGPLPGALSDAIAVHALNDGNLVIADSVTNVLAIARGVK
jgi:hypothetical protein